nr:MAG TPA: EEP-1 [Caudoviricetes sp.]
MSEILIGRCGRTKEGQIRINKKSDFPLTLKLMKDGNFIKWYDCDFDIKAFVEDGFTTYTAGRSEGVFNHCRLEEDGTLTLFFDNHNLSVGELQIEVVFHHPDNDYGTDGVRQEAFTVATNILLVNDNGNALSLSIPEPKVVEKVVEKEVEKVVEVEVSRKENVNVFNVLGFDGFVESANNIEAETATANYTILFDKQNKRFVALHEGSYSANWHIEQLDRTDEIYQIFSNSGVLRDCYTNALQRMTPTGTWNDFMQDSRSKSRIDHIFVSSDFKVPHYAIFTNSYWLGKSRRNISDHYPVMVKLIFAQDKTLTK